MTTEKEHTYRNVSAPYNSAISNEFVNVSIRDDELIEWCYTHTANGSFVSGYIITKKKTNPI